MIFFAYALRVTDLVGMDSVIRPFLFLHPYIIFILTICIYATMPRVKKAGQ